MVESPVQVVPLRFPTALSTYPQHGPKTRHITGLLAHQAAVEDLDSQQELLLKPVIKYISC